MRLNVKHKETKSLARITLEKVGCFVQNVDLESQKCQKVRETTLFTSIRKTILFT